MANDPTTFEGLKISLGSRLNRDDLEESGILPEIIAEVERGFQREIMIPEREGVTTLSPVTNSVALPADFHGVVTVYVDGSTDTPLERVTPTRLRELYPTSATGIPCHFAIEGENMLLGPYPSASLSIKLTYIQKFTPLNDSDTTNWLLTDHPDLYIHACLAELHDYFRNVDQANRERSKAAVIMESVNRSGRRRLTNSGPLRANSPVRNLRLIRA